MSVAILETAPAGLQAAPTNFKAIQEPFLLTPEVVYDYLERSTLDRLRVPGVAGWLAVNDAMVTAEAESIARESAPGIEDDSAGLILPEVGGFDDIRGQIITRAFEIGVDKDDLHIVLGLAEKLRDCGDGGYTSVHCLSVGLLTSKFAELTGADPREGLLAGILHDFWKQYRKRVLLKSVLGKDKWTDADTDAIGLHALGGALVAAEYGFPASIVYAIAQHHAYQRRPVDNHQDIISLLPHLFPSGKPPKDVHKLIAALVDGDVTHAALSRNDGWGGSANRIIKVTGLIREAHQLLGLPRPFEDASRARGRILSNSIATQFIKTE